MSETLEAQLHAALAREARLRKALKEHLVHCKWWWEDTEGRVRCEHCSGVSTRGGENSISHDPWCSFERADQALLSPSPLAEAAGEVLEAAVAEADAVDMVRRAEAIDRYRALLREGGEEG